MNKKLFFNCINPVNFFNIIKEKFVNYKNKKMYEWYLRYSYKLMNSIGNGGKVPSVYDGVTMKDIEYSAYNYATLNPIHAVMNAVNKVYGNMWHCTKISGIEVTTNDNDNNDDKRFVNVVIKTERPGIIIGSKGKDIDRLENELETIFGVETKIDLVEVKKSLVNIFSYNF